MPHYHLKGSCKFFNIEEKIYTKKGWINRTIGSYLRRYWRYDSRLQVTREESGAYPEKFTSKDFAYEWYECSDDKCNKKVLKVWTNTHHAMSSASIVIAETREKAAEILETHMKKYGFTGILDATSMVEIDTTVEHSVILCRHTTDYRRYDV